MKNVVRLTHDTQSLKTKQMVKSTLKVQTNSKSLKAIKIIGSEYICTSTRS